MIYVLKTRGLNPPLIKIGTARKSMTDRIKSLQTGCPHILDLVYAKNGGLKEERALHLKLKEHRVTGEWFRWNSDTMKELGLKDNCKPIDPANPESFLTPRQKQINYLFRRGNYINSLHPQTFELFLSRHQYKKEEFFDFPKRKRKFHLVLSNAKEIRSYFGSLESCLNDKDEEKEQYFIMPLNVPIFKDNA
jgi:hypothetical protein